MFLDLKAPPKSPCEISAPNPDMTHSSIHLAKKYLFWARQKLLNHQITLLLKRKNEPWLLCCHQFRVSPYWFLIYHYMQDFITLCSKWNEHSFCRDSGWLALLLVNIFLALPLLQAYWVRYLCVTSNNECEVWDYNRWLMRTTHAMGGEQGATRHYLWESHVNSACNLTFCAFLINDQSSV